MQYRRSRAKGATFFFTVVTHGRKKVTVQHTHPPGLPHRGGGNVFPPPLVGGVGGGGGTVTKKDIMQ